MNLRGAFAVIRWSLKRRGLLGTATHALGRAFRAVVPRRERPHPFDARSGVDTGGLLGVEKIASGHPHDWQTTAYFGSQPSVFLGVMNHWVQELEHTAQRVEDFTFVDIGCGKGRVLMLASEFPFRQILGIELSSLLVRTARENLRRWSRSPHPCAKIAVVESDVLDVPLPDGPALLFMYHPFEAELFGRWVESLMPALNSRAAPLYLAYLNPVYEHMLGRLHATRLLWTGEIPFSAEEAAVHQFGGTAEHISLYRITAAAD